ncbi:MAG TPA: glycosyltransferase family 4 protein [Candidatus Saccharimonadales bacterium]|jgi:phosphatidylinositol alpha-mannosyltransferase|nr:glycosyltransferase family 4 protein [Candidatus Saccharimonadales bacterium]
MKIAFVLDDSLDKTDGVQQYVLTLSAWLREQGHDVHYIVGETTRTDLPNIHSVSRNVNVRFNHNRMSIPLPTSKRTLRALLAAEQFDVLHVQLPYSPWMARRVIQAAGPRTVVIGTFHIAPHSWLVHAGNILLNLCIHRSLRRFDHIMSVSSVAQAFAKQTYGIVSDVVPNTVDLRPFLQAKPLPQYEDVRTVVFLGRLVERKGCHHLLEAVRLMHEAGLPAMPFRVIICGRGPLEQSLKDYVRTNHLEQIVTFVGFVPEAEKPRYLASADVAIFPSTGGESFGIVLLEAMAAARGVVLGGNNPGYASVMRNHPEALFDPTNAGILAETLSNWLTDATAREEAYDWQHAYVAQFDVPAVGQEIVTIYERALQARQNMR